MKIRKANISDIDKIIILHKHSFDSSHFSKVFSHKMLKNYFEKFFSMNQFCYVIFDEQGKELLGYEIAGFNTDRAVSEYSKENFIKLVLILLIHPEFLVEKIIELFKKIFKKDFPKKAKCRLFLIAVNDKYKGKGIGKKLISHLENSLINAGIKLYGLSVRRENKSAIDFYHKNGYIIEHKNRKSIYFYKEL